MTRTPKLAKRPRAHVGLTIVLASVVIIVSAWSNGSVFHTTLQAQSPTVVLPLHVHLTPGTDTVPSWIEERVERANLIFQPHRIRFAISGSEPLDAVHADLPDRTARDALERYLRAQRINIFVVDRLADVDIAGRDIRGVHWRYRAERSRHYIILSRLGGAGVLAHELGHFLGNPRHSQEEGNVMSYSWGTSTPIFSPSQARRMSAYIRQSLERGELISSPLRTSPHSGILAR